MGRPRAETAGYFHRKREACGRGARPRNLGSRASRQPVRRGFEGKVPSAAVWKSTTGVRLGSPGTRCNSASRARAALLVDLGLPAERVGLVAATCPSAALVCDAKPRRPPEGPLSVPTGRAKRQSRLRSTSEVIGSSTHTRCGPLTSRFAVTSLVLTEVQPDLSADDQVRTSTFFLGL